jgi:hypothetical protein
MKTRRARNFFLFCLIVPMMLSGGRVFGANFEELDKPPEGIYKSQILVGGFASMGIAKGSAIDAEKNFVSGSSYTFTDSETAKAFWINHLSYSFGVYGEYVIIDYLGVTAKSGYSSVVQRTNFGKDYANKSAVLYRDFFFMLGPVVHATNRKPWDVSFAPMIGFSKGKYHASPVAAQYIDGYDPKNSSGKSSALVYGADLKLSLFFSGGFVMSVGGEWTRNNIILPGSINEHNPQTGKRYMNGSTSGTLDNYRVVFSGGYAFQH